MSDKGWKKAERAFARDRGSERIPVTGEREGADFHDGIALYQIKVRLALPDWIFKWLAGIVRKAATDPIGRVGVLVVNRPRKPRRHAIVMLRWDDWCALHGEPQREIDGESQPGLCAAVESRDRGEARGDD